MVNVSGLLPHHDVVGRAVRLSHRRRPRRQAKWYGTTRVVSKRLHPEWRPTAGMRQKNPRLPEVVKPGPANPLGTRAIYLADFAPHPRNQRPLLHRHQCVERMLSDVPRGRRGTLQSGPAGDTSDRPAVIGSGGAPS